MKQLLLFALLCTAFIAGFAQQEIKFGYQFRPADFNTDSNKLYIKKGDNYELRQFGQTLRGVISKRDKDTLFVSLWPGIDASSSTIKLDPSKGGDEDEYIILVKDWNPAHRKYKSIDIPFKQQQFTATNIPFRVKFRDSVTLQSEFLNVNVTYLWMWGKTRFYQSKFVTERNRSFAIGPFLGLSTLENPATEKDEFGLNYGINMMFSVNKLHFVIAGGAENGFKKETKRLHPYIGFGMGFKLVEMFEPEIEKE